MCIHVVCIHVYHTCIDWVLLVTRGRNLFKLLLMVTLVLQTAVFSELDLFVGERDLVLKGLVLLGLSPSGLEDP